MKKHLFSTFIAIITCFAVQLTAFAAESTANEMPYTEYEVSTESDSEIVLYGSLSGYASHTHHSGDALECSFPIQVSGSWSPFAGWTVKTNFSDSCRISYVYLTRPDGTKIGDTLYPGPNDELANKALFNVPTGTYTVHYGLSTSCDGTIQVYIY